MKIVPIIHAWPVLITELSKKGFAKSRKWGFLGLGDADKDTIGGCVALNSFYRFPPNLLPASVCPDISVGAIAITNITITKAIVVVHSNLPFSFLPKIKRCSADRMGVSASSLRTIIITFHLHHHHSPPLRSSSEARGHYWRGHQCN